jgi:hypothetical protein
LVEGATDTCSVGEGVAAIICFAARLQDGVVASLDEKLPPDYKEGQTRNHPAAQAEVSVLDGYKEAA